MQTVTIEKEAREDWLIFEVLKECKLPLKLEIKGLTDRELYDAIRAQPDYDNDELTHKLVDIVEEFFRCTLGFDDLARLLRSLPRS